MKRTAKIITLLLLIAMSGCRIHYDDNEDVFFLYKTKNDYSDNVMVTLTDITQTGERLVSNIYTYHQMFVNGYESRGCCEYNPDNSAFLSITIEEWDVANQTIPRDSLTNYIIDSDPFVEFYEVSANYSSEEINNILQNGEMDKYFRRLK